MNLVEYRLASIHKVYGDLCYAPVSGEHLPLIAEAVRRGMTHPAIAENWLERRVDDGEWERA